MQRNYNEVLEHSFYRRLIEKTAHFHIDNGMPEKLAYGYARYETEKTAAQIGGFARFLQNMGNALKGGADDLAATIKTPGGVKPVKDVANTSGEATAKTVQQTTGTAQQAAKETAEQINTAPKMRFQFDEAAQGAEKINIPIGDRLRAMGVNTLRAAGENPGVALAGTGAGLVGTGMVLS